MAAGIIRKVLEYFGNLLAVASLVTLLLGVFGVFDLAEGWVVAAFAAFWAGIGIASVGNKLGKPRTKRTRSNRAPTVRSGSGSAVLVGVGYLTGSYRINKISGRRKPGYRFKVNEAPVILRNNSVTLGSGDEWTLKASRRRAVVRSKDGSHLAEAFRMRPDANRWVISDAAREFEATVAKAKPRKAIQRNRLGYVVNTTKARARDLTLFRSGGTPEPVASVHLSYEVHDRDNLQTGAREFEGVFDGTMDFSAPVPIAVAVLALRLALGRWALLGPRTGTWEPNYGGA